METIIDYVIRLEEEKTMSIWTKRNIMNYTSDPDAANDKKYPKTQQVVRQKIRREDEKTKAQGGVIDWSYLLSHVDSEF